MAINKVPEMINDMRVYEEGSDNFVGVADVELPELSSQTVSITGIGVAGEIDAPVHGHFSSMEAKLNWRTQHETGIRFAGGTRVAIECHADIQGFDGGADEYTHDHYRVVIRGRAKSYEQGKLAPASTSDSSNTIEVHYLKIEYNDNVIREIDKYNYKDITNGVDALEIVRRNIGLS